MPTFRSAEVTEVLSRRTGLQRLAVRMADGGEARAYALTELTGDARVGDTVICNTTAVERSLGTGGWHVVHWNTTRSELVAPGPDHIMKLRYTSLQADIGSSELLHPEAADRELAGTPVIVCTLHSQVAAVAVGFAHGAPGRRLAYVMTDGAALPLALSDLVADLMQRKLLVGSVTAGHAFGGDLEAVTPASALGLAAHVLDADAIVLAMGPGVVGTGTSLGTTALEAAGLLDLAERRGGRPVLCVRASEGDERGRHQGVSHHVRTVVELCRCRPTAPAVPAEVSELTGLEVVPAPTSPPAAALLDAAELTVTTMGRGPDEDPVFFEAATAAGAVAAADGCLTTNRLKRTGCRRARPSVGAWTSSPANSLLCPCWNSTLGP